MVETTNIMSYDIFVGELDLVKSTPDKKQVINTLNAHSYVIAQKDQKFKEALQASDILLPDGSAIVLAERVLNNNKIKRIAGADIHEHLLKMQDKEQGSVFYMGSSQKTLDAIHQRLSKEYPNIKVGSYSPPFKADFTAEEDQMIIDHVNAFAPDVLFIGMTAPKQEKWLHDNQKRLDFKIASSIGAVFDFYAGNVKRAPVWMQESGLEWLHRALSSWRLAKRYMYSNPLFLKALFLERLK